MYKKNYLKAKKTRKQNDKKKGGAKKPSKKSKKTRKNIKGGKLKGGAVKKSLKVNVVQDPNSVESDMIIIKNDQFKWSCEDCETGSKVPSGHKMDDGEKLYKSRSPMNKCNCSVTKI